MPNKNYTAKTRWLWTGGAVASLLLIWFSISVLKSAWLIFLIIIVGSIVAVILPFFNKS
jgi:hypothetical protein